MSLYAISNKLNIKQQKHALKSSAYYSTVKEVFSESTILATCVKFFYKQATYKVTNKAVTYLNVQPDSRQPQANKEQVLDLFREIFSNTSSKKRFKSFQKNGQYS